MICMLSMSKLHISTFSTASKPYSIHLNPFTRLSCSNQQSGWNQPCRGVTQLSHSHKYHKYFINSPALTTASPISSLGNQWKSVDQTTARSSAVTTAAYHQASGAPQLRATSSGGSPSPKACHRIGLQWWFPGIPQ